MPYVLVRHKIEDYAKWKPVFDEDAAARKPGGSQGGQLFRNANDPNEILIIFQWDTLDNAQKFVQSPQLAAKMQQAGVTDQPDVYFLEEIEKLSV
jgi:antibiotic biosynthesis monooxygenase (ABM) superfamily enzyme